MIAAESIVDRFGSVSLEELVQRAALLTRLDRKYILPIADLPLMLGALPDSVRVLEIGGLRQFGYRSAYFDSPGLECYLDAARRRPRRFKIRTRTYAETGRQFLEVKTRGRRGHTVKQRAPLSRGGDGRHLGSDARAYGKAVLAGNGIHCDLTGFGLVLTTDYRRTTLFVPATGSRITIDTSITWTLPDGSAIHIPDLAFVETKSNRAIPEVDRLLWSLKHRPCSVSKYGTGLAALRPDLPSHHWRRVLRRHFSSHSPSQFPTTQERDDNETP